MASNGEEEIKLQLEDLNKREWFFQDVSRDQIELILKQSKDNTFLVTNGAFDGEFVLYMNVGNHSSDPGLAVVKVTLCMKKQENGAIYYFKDQEEEFTSPVEAIETFTSLSEFHPNPVVRSHVTQRQESIQSQTSNDVDLPPDYAASATFPGVTQQLPEIKSKVDIKKGEDADDEIAPRDILGYQDYTHNAASDTRSLHRWSTHLHYHQDLHCCHPRNTWHCCCHRGYKQRFYSAGSYSREWYDIRGVGPCRGICLLLFYCVALVFCACWMPCLGVCLCILCAAQEDDD
jgi:hypothetical protein